MIQQCFMTNEEKLEFIKANYRGSRMVQLLKGDKKAFYDEWIARLILTVPKRLFKYRECNEDNLAALKSRKAWFSNPNTWNDPIDVTVAYDLQRDIDYLREHFDDYVLKFAFSFINRYIESFCAQKGFVTSEKVKKVYYSAFEGEEGINFDRIVSCLEPIVGWKPARQIAVKTQEAFAQATKSDFKDRIIGGLDKLLGVNGLREKVIMYSLSETHDNNHQWAVYADGGKGFCIGYRISPKNEEDASLIANLLPIYYGHKRPLSICRMLDESLTYSLRPETLSDLVDQESESLFVSLHTKNPEWSGEQEWRFCIPEAKPIGDLIDFDYAEAIYLGENIEPKWKELLIQIAAEQNLTVYQRKLDSTKSRWLYDRIPS